MLYLREIWHFKPKKLLHQGIVNGSIANFLQYCYDTILNIELYFSQYCKKIYFFYSSYFPRNFSLILFIFSTLFSLFLLCFSIYSLLSEASSPKFLTHLQNFSPISHNLSLISHRTTSLSLHQYWVLDFWGWRLEVGLAWIDELGLDRWAGIGWWWVWIGWSMGLKWWICWSVGGSFGLIIGSSDGGSGDDFWVFFTAWVSNRRRGFVDQWLGFADRWLGWWVWWPLLAPTGLMVCLCVALLMVCVCVCCFVVVGLWLKWLVLLGFRWVFFFFFF